MSARDNKVIPTRRELIKARNRKQLAESIVEILLNEFEILIRALVEYREVVTTYQKYLDQALTRAFHHFIKAEMVEGARKIKELALTTPQKNHHLSPIKIHSLLGIDFPGNKLNILPYKDIEGKNRYLDYPMHLIKTSYRIDDVVKFIVELGNLTIAIRELIELIAIKRRQINVLQHKKIPDLEHSIKYIEKVLNEIEQQDAVRVRVLQRKRKEKVKMREAYES